MKELVGRTIVSQYGLVCEVLEVNGDMLKCLSRYNGKVWEWLADTVSLVTRDGEILDMQNGEVFGRINDQGHWELYPDEQCRTLSPEDVEREFRGKTGGTV